MHARPPLLFHLAIRGCANGNFDFKTILRIGSLLQIKNDSKRVYIFGRQNVWSFSMFIKCLSFFYEKWSGQISSKMEIFEILGLIFGIETG
jgi:hypothetical protein